MMSIVRLHHRQHLHFEALPPLALYVHLPWCVRKCPYCDFNSHVAKPFKVDVSSLQQVPEDIEAQYIKALVADMDNALPLVWGRRVHSIFFGGGTPSLFSAEGIAQLLSEIRARFGTIQTGEITLEANPGTFEAKRFEGYRNAGVTRLSLGVQSFSDAHLQSLGRVHNAEQAMAALKHAKTVFDAVNVDLMYGLPKQTPAQAQLDLDTALAYQPQHLSLYQLTLEPNTTFAMHPPVLPDEDVMEGIEAVLQHNVAKAGYQRYEISAYATAVQHRCAHNLNYWMFGDYLGIGAGAHSKLSFPERVLRFAAIKNPQAYVDAVLNTDLDAKAGADFLKIESSTTGIKTDVLNGFPKWRGASLVAVSELPFEFMLNALRLIDGVPATLYAERTGRSLADVAKTIQHAVAQGLMVDDPTRIQATHRGLLHLNAVQGLFLADDCTDID